MVFIYVIDHPQEPQKQYMFVIEFNLRELLMITPEILTLRKQIFTLFAESRRKNKICKHKTAHAWSWSWFIF